MKIDISKSLENAEVKKQLDLAANLAPQLIEKYNSLTKNKDFSCGIVMGIMLQFMSRFESNMRESKILLNEYK